jgi:hypothetical protein
VVIDGEVSRALLLPRMGLAVKVNRGRRVLVSTGLLELVHGRGVCLEDFPSLSVVQLHPVVLSVLDLAGALKCLSEQLAKVVIIWCILEAKVPDVAKVLVELLCAM